MPRSSHARSGRRHRAGTARSAPRIAATTRSAAAKVRYAAAAIALLAASFSAPRAGLADDQAEPILLDTTVVTATRVPEPLREVPAAVSVVDERAIQEARPTVSLAEPLNRVPGVLVQEAGNAAQDARIQIRGFGTRAAFGIREIRVLVDGLPQTLPDGQTQIDDVDLASLGRIEVLRGPASSLYGNASGGVIQLFTKDAPEVPTIATRVTGGSYGLLKTALEGGGRAGSAALYVQGSYFGIAGYREHATAYDGIVNAKLRVGVADGTAVTFLLNAVDAPLADDPGGLTRAQVREDPRQARDLNVELDAGEAVQQARAGFVLDHASGPHALSAYAYVLYRDFDSLQPIPPELGDGVVTFHRTSPGGGFRYDFTAPVFGLAQTLTVGLDVQEQDDGRRRFVNQGGERGALALSEDESVRGIGAYLRESVFVTETFELAGGVRWDDVRFAVDVLHPPGEDGSGSRTFREWSPGGGVLWAASPWLTPYVNVGTTFQTPTTTELVDPDGPGFNPAIEPQRATSWEIGARAGGDDVEGGLAAYLIEVRDELIPFESPSGRVAFRNAGRSRRLGLELDGQARLTPWLTALGRAVGLDGPLLPGALDWVGSLTVLDAEYTSYTTEAGDFGGNAEPGIPGWQVYQQLAWRHPVGAFVALEGFFVDGYFVDDANTARSRGYVLANLRLGLTRQLGRFAVEPFFGVQNLLGQSYDGTVRLNALGGRYFEPAPGINVYGGVALSARL